MKYKELKIQEYMNCPMFSSEQSGLLLKLRTRTVRGIRTDFGDMYLQKGCPLAGCFDTCDSLSHVLVCPALQKVHDNTRSHSYTDVFSEDVHIQKQKTTHYARLLQQRDKLLEEGTPDDDLPGPSGLVCKL